MISTKGRYALRIMLDLASRDPECYTPLEEIAEQQNISKKYLEIIIKVLVQNKLVRGLRGKGGGYRLTRKPEDYSIGEILELSEGTLAIVACVQSDSAPCERSESCRTLPMWKKFDRMVHDFFYGITLADLLQEKTES